MANVLGLAMGGPTVIAHGTDEQKDRYLQPILIGRGDLVPGLLGARLGLGPRLGQDHAPCATATTGSSPARRCGRRWPTTRSGACSSRAPTSTRPSTRASRYFLMDMEQDAVQVRPLRQITGEAEFNELFLEEARIPNENIVGGEGNGWMVAITTLMHERATLAFGLQVAVQIALRELIEKAKSARQRRRGVRRTRSSASAWPSSTSRPRCCGSTPTAA